MCSILAGVGAAAALAGTGLTMAAQNKSRNEMKKVQAAESVRQSRFQDEAKKHFAVSEQNATPANQLTKLLRGQTERGAAYEAAMQPNPGALPALPVSGTDGSPRVIASELSGALAKGRRYNTQQAGAQAKLGGYGDLNLSNAIQNAQQMGKLSMVGNLARGSASVLPYEMQGASNKGDNLMQLGQLISALGMASGVAGLATAPASTAAALPNATTVGGTGSMASSSPFLTNGASIGRLPDSSLFLLPPGY